MQYNTLYACGKSATFQFLIIIIVDSTIESLIAVIKLLLPTENCNFNYHNETVIAYRKFSSNNNYNDQL